MGNHPKEYESFKKILKEPKYKYDEITVFYFDSAEPLVRRKPMSEPSLFFKRALV